MRELGEGGGAERLGGGGAVRHTCSLPSSGASGRGLVYSGGSVVGGEEGVHLIFSEALLALLYCSSLFVATRVPTAQATATGEEATVLFGGGIPCPPPCPSIPPLSLWPLSASSRRGALAGLVLATGTAAQPSPPTRGADRRERHRSPAVGRSPSLAVRHMRQRWQRGWRQRQRRGVALGTGGLSPAASVASDGGCRGDRGGGVARGPCGARARLPAGGARAAYEGAPPAGAPRPRRLRGAGDAGATPPPLPVCPFRAARGAGRSKRSDGKGPPSRCGEGAGGGRGEWALQSLPAGRVRPFPAASAVTNLLLRGRGGGHPPPSEPGDGSTDAVHPLPRSRDRSHHRRCLVCHPQWWPPRGRVSCLRRFAWRHWRWRLWLVCVGGEGIGS